MSGLRGDGPCLGSFDQGSGESHLGVAVGGREGRCRAGVAVVGRLVRVPAICVAGVGLYVGGRRGTGAALECGVAVHRCSASNGFGVAGYGEVWHPTLTAHANGSPRRVALYRDLEDERMVACSLQGWGYALRLAGAPEEAQRLEEQGLAIVHRLGDPRGLAWARHDLGEIAFVRGDVDHAQRLLEEGCRRFADLGLPMAATALVDAPATSTA